MPHNRLIEVDSSQIIGGLHDFVREEEKKTSIQMRKYNNATTINPSHMRLEVSQGQS